MLYNKKIFLSAAVLAGTSFAQDSTTGTSDATSTDSGAGAECTLSYARILGGAPTPSSDLANALTSYASSAAASVTVATTTGSLGGYSDLNQFLSQACDFSSQLPSSLQSQFDDYATSLISYVSASSSQIDDVITSCIATGSEGAGYTSLVNSLATHTGPLCTGTATSTGTESSTTPTSTDGGAGGAGGGSQTTGGGGDAGSSSVPTGAATVPTVALGGAAAAAAGILGAAILL